MESQGKKVDTSRLNYQLISNSKHSDDRCNEIDDYIYLHREASNPGPSHKGCHSKQKRLGDFFHQHHIKKDDKDMWCKEKGYTIENIAGDENGLYACLGRSRKFTGDRVRQIIHDNADRLWSAHMEHDADETELASFKERTLDRT
eukprot:5477001-Heterocapsa_arctica.AAC.1